MKRVLVVDDSEIAREALTAYIESDGDLCVVGTAGDAASAISAVAALGPHVVTMDIQMPGEDGLAAIEQIMAHNPVPIVVVSAQARGDQTLPFEAVKRGALEVAVKPASRADAAALRAALRRVAGIPVVPHVRALRAARAGVDAAPRLPPSNAARIVGIAASAGGPAALDVVLGALPANLHACVALVQHLPPDFVAPFATYLRSRTPLEVVLLGPGEAIDARPGHLVLAPAEHHLAAVSPHRLGAVPTPPVRGHRPSATVMFASLARFVGNRALGVILTGIGDDGAAGLADLRARGGLTLAQDERTCAVYGMPRAAFELGAISRVLPLPEIPAAIRQAVGVSNLR
ncbi:MAG TPA: chemotaxis protein CheB [Kofleriaceae bacterium]|nr:chemotaxis protein CheB [Kofleriaceae bacterium]